MIFFSPLKWKLLLLALKQKLLIVLNQYFSIRKQLFEEGGGGGGGGGGVASHPIHPLWISPWKGNKIRLGWGGGGGGGGGRVTCPECIYHYIVIDRTGNE